MTEREIREVRERWDEAHERLKEVRRAIASMWLVKNSLSAECERLAEIIAEHDNTPIVITEDDGGIE